MLYLVAFFTTVEAEVDDILILVLFLDGRLLFFVDNGFKTRSLPSLQVNPREGEGG